jgi:hypothetical protein
VQGTLGEGPAVGGSAAEVRDSVRREAYAASAGDTKGISREVRAASAGINSVRREAREGRVEVRPTASRTN